MMISFEFDYVSYDIVFHLTRPADHELAVDYDAGIATLEALQKRVERSGICKNMIIEDVTGKMIRLVKNVFVKQEKVVPDSPHGMSVEDAPRMDNETRDWPIPENFAIELDKIKYGYEAEPLPLYHDGHLVEPSHANDVINGAMVEVHFGILHWHIGNFDSFQANVEKNRDLEAGFRTPCVSL
ncbi:hypothetical protein EV702DRAFT_1199899 [Suillus placidus]|uniref:Uncharacterized protein n=1 Tax=Suillus placidus TaxID=48579 RepID=A0A9P6ZQG8_9AGAM|nr:hypothetical protein EV702DRAFT_1199899 [Suillus placidus]